jgi:hypothetical protein
VQADPAVTQDPFSSASGSAHRTVAGSGAVRTAPPTEQDMSSAAAAAGSFSSVSGGDASAVETPGASGTASAVASPSAPMPATAAPRPRSAMPASAAPPPPSRPGSTAPGVVTVGAGASTYINVSARMMNEIVVPFANPRVVKFLRASSRASIQQDGNSIYVSTGNEEFIQLIVKDADQPTAAGFSVTLIPVEDIPGQHVVLRTEGGGSAAAGGGESLTASDYVDLLRELMREAARETLPPAYARDGGWGGATLQVGPVEGRSLYRAIGSQFVVEYYELRNAGAAGVELVETNFATKGVRAIAFMDAVVLAPGQAGRMVWVKDR